MLRINCVKGVNVEIVSKSLGSSLAYMHGITKSKILRTEISNRGYSYVILQCDECKCFLPSDLRMLGCDINA